MNSANNSSKIEKIIVYVDGFNLYFGLFEANLDYCKY